jgi:SAM-dependent methyltransferase
VVWDALRPALDDRAARAERAVLDIVDAGGGTGGFAVPLARLGHRITVVDPSPDALAALERRAVEGNVTERIRAIQGDIAGLLDVVRPATADVVLCHGVLEHADDPAAALDTIGAVLRADATISILVANRNAIVLSRALAGHFSDAAHALADPAGRWGEPDPVPRRFDAATLLALLSDAGFDVELVHGVRIFTDLVHGALLDSEPGNAEALLALESAAAGEPAFRDIATQLHALGTRQSAT